MISRFLRYFFGDLQREEAKKFLILGLTFFFIIGSYWLLTTQKNAMFDRIVGYAQYQPIVKMLSIVMILPLVLLYSKLVDIFDRGKLLILFSLFFCTGLSLIAVLLNHPTIGLANTQAGPHRYFGWFLFLFVESFGAIMPGLFWAFVTSSTTTESAKRGYPLIVGGAQIGSIAGAFLSWKSKSLGNVFLFKLSVFGTCCIMMMLFVYFYCVPSELQAGSESGPEKPKTGVFEGLKLLLTRPYIAGVFALSTLHEVVATIVEFQMNVLAKQSGLNLDSFNGMYGVMVNTLALLFALLGTGAMMRRRGLRFCLMFFPIATGAVMLATTFKPILLVAVIATVTVKGLSYALNNPSKEMMYIPTSKDVRFKAKGWIDMFGSRLSKASGSGVNWLSNFLHFNLFAFGGVVSLGVIAVWFVIASFVGVTFETLTKENKIVE